MGWALWINSTDRTSLVSRSDGDGVDLEFMLNERATARFTCLSSLVPSRLDQVQIYEQDGATLLFGGLIHQRRTKPRPNKHDHYRTECECSDYGLYAEWCYQTKAYTSSVGLSSVLADLVTDKLGAYGITLASSQVAGPALAPFAWVTMRVSDALRELSDRTGYAWLVHPDRSLEMFVPGTDAAPNSLSDADPNCLQALWADTDAIPANRVVVACGPAGTPWVTQIWISSANASWTTDIPAAGGTAGYVTVNSIFKTVGDGAGYEWDQTTSTLSLGTANTPAAGQVIALSYVAQFPFEAVATAVGSPVIEALYSAPEITSYDAGLEMAQGLLDQLQGAATDLEFLSKEDGWKPGQELPVALTARSLNATYAMTSVRVRLHSDNRWLYTCQAIETTKYNGSYLERWREMRGQGSSTGISVLPSDGGTGVPPTYALGGSRFHMVQVPA